VKTQKTYVLTNRQSQYKNCKIHWTGRSAFECYLICGWIGLAGDCIRFMVENDQKNVIHILKILYMEVFVNILGSETNVWDLWAMSFSFIFMTCRSPIFCMSTLIYFGMLACMFMKTSFFNIKLRVSTNYLSWLLNYFLLVVYIFIKYIISITKNFE